MTCSQPKTFCIALLFVTNFVIKILVNVCGNSDRVSDQVDVNKVVVMCDSDSNIM